MTVLIFLAKCAGAFLLLAVAEHVITGGWNAYMIEREWKQRDLRKGRTKKC